MLSFLCLRGVRVGGRGENNDDHKSLSFSVFHKSDEGQKQKTRRRWHKAIIFMSKRSENRRMRWRRQFVSSFVFHRSNKGKKKKKKKHKDDNFVSLSSCLNRTRTRGRGKENDNQRSLSSLVFHRSDRS
jgi:hypothetical protein